MSAQLAADVLRYGTAAGGIAALTDSPIPGPGDGVGVLIIGGTAVAAGSIIAYDAIKSTAVCAYNNAKLVWDTWRYAKSSKKSKQKQDQGLQRVEVPRVTDAARKIQKTGEKLSDAVKRLKGQFRPDEISKTRKYWQRKGQ